MSRAKLLSLVMVCLLAGNANSASALKVGDPAPSLAVKEWLQVEGPAPKDWTALAGQAVVLEFWATWCAPCVHAIPHINEMAEKFKAKPVRFLAVTDEGTAKVTPFLKRKQMKAWVGCLAQEMFKSYEAESIPKTVLIDAKGRIAWIGSPLALSEELLGAALEGKDLAQFAVQDETDSFEIGVPPDLTGEPPVYQVMIRPHTEKSDIESGGGESENAISSYGIRLQDAIAEAWEIDVIRMAIPDSVKSDKSTYDVFIKVPKDGPSKQQIYHRALSDTFGLSDRREKRKLDVYVLSKGKTEPAGLQKPGEALGTSGSKTSLMLNAQPVDSLARNLESRVGRPVLNETGLAELYDMELRWTGEGPEPILEAVRKQLGLEIKADKREIEFVVIEKRGKDK